MQTHRRCSSEPKYFACPLINRVLIKIDVLPTHHSLGDIGTTFLLSERLNHKNWKARVSGYESLIKTFQTTASDTDPASKPYINNSDLLKKIATDSNAVAREKGVECHDIGTFIRFRRHECEGRGLRFSMLAGNFPLAMEWLARIQVWYPCFNAGHCHTANCAL
jgi:hypothetical protein